MAGLRVHVVMPPDLVELVDRAKAPGESRGAFVRRALEQALGEAGRSGQGQQPSAVTGGEVQSAGINPRPASARASFVKPFKPAPKSG